MESAPPVPNSTMLPCREPSSFNRNPVEIFIQMYIFPVQFAAAIFGNTLTLAVLLSGASNRSNKLLAGLAMCDICVFLSYIPVGLAIYEGMYTSFTFRSFYFEWMPTIGFICNVFTLASIWFVLAISVERLLIIKFPFRSLSNNQGRQVTVIAIAIYVICTSLAYYVKYETLYESKIACNGTQVVARRHTLQMENDTFIHQHVPQWIQASHQYLRPLHAIGGILIPIVIVIAINISLLRLVKRSNNNKELVRSSSSCRPRRSDEQERSMTRAIVAIVTCFSITQGPSTVLYMAMQFRSAFDLPVTNELTKILQTLSIIMNSVVLTGKMLNVVLFCLTSASFRHRLCLTLTRWCYRAGICKRPPLNRKYVVASTEDGRRVSLRPASTSDPRPSTQYLELDVSKSLLTQKSSVASIQLRGGRTYAEQVPMRSHSTHRSNGNGSARPLLVDDHLRPDNNNC